MGGICKSKNGNYAIVGTASYNDGDDQRVFFALITETGDVTQSGTFPSTLTQSGFGIAPTSDGGFIVTGGMEVSGHRYVPMFMKLNSQGQITWTRAVDEGVNAFCFSVTATPDGGYAAAGSTNISSFTPDLYVVKVNASGEKQWSQTYGGAKDDAGYGIVASGDDVVASGYFKGSDNRYEAALIRLDGNDGYEKWTQTFQIDGESTAGRRLCTTKDGGFALTGSTSVGNGDGAVLFLKTDENGLIQ